MSVPCTIFFYLRYSQSQGDASQQEQVTVDPVHQFVDAAINVDVVSNFAVLQVLHALTAHGVDNHLLKWRKNKYIFTSKNVTNSNSTEKYQLRLERKVTFSLVMIQQEKGTEQRSLLGLSLVQLK